MRVLVVELQGRGGIWHYANAYSCALQEIGVQTALATCIGFERLPGTHLPVIAIDGRVAPSPRLGGPVRRVWNHGRKLIRLARALEEFRPDIVHLQGPLGELDFLYVRWLKARGIGVVYTAHNPRPRHGRGGWLHRARHRAADAMIILSDTGARDLTADGVGAAKISRQPHGNYLQFASPPVSPGDAKRALGLPGDARVVLFFGGIAGYKGLDVLIDSFAILRSLHPDAYLVIAGKPMDTFDGYRRRIARLEIGDAVIARPEYIPLVELPSYFVAADVVAFPYRRSYQSGVLQLAYAFARPVVVTETSDLGAQVTVDGTGMVSTLDPADFAQSLAAVLADDAQAAAMGARGRTLAQTKYSWDAIARASLVLYEQVRQRITADRRSAPWQRAVKRGIDVMASATALVVLSPLYAAIAAAIKVSSPGPVLYRWPVVGEGGRPLRAYKFRTMVVDADDLKAHLLDRNEATGPVFKMRDDPRVTRVGRILRKFSLDELPQLWSVLKGDMSLVGPRPMLVREWEQLEPWQRRKLSTRPGIVCLWHFYGQPRDFDEWVKLDLQYVDRWSLWLDLKLLLWTPVYIISGRNY